VARNLGGACAGNYRTVGLLPAATPTTSLSSLEADPFALVSGRGNQLDTAPVRSAWADNAGFPYPHWRRPDLQPRPTRLTPHGRQPAAPLSDRLCAAAASGIAGLNSHRPPGTVLRRRPDIRAAAQRSAGAYGHAIGLAVGPDLFPKGRLHRPAFRLPWPPHPLSASSDICDASLSVGPGISLYKSFAPARPARVFAVNFSGGEICSLSSDIFPFFLPHLVLAFTQARQFLQARWVSRRGVRDRWHGSDDSFPYPI